MNSLTNKLKLTLLLAVAVMISACETKENLNASKSNNPYEKKVDSILKLMTLEEKLGQLNLPGAGDITTGQAQSSDIAKKIEEQLTYPGQIRVTVIRETRAVEYAR